MIKSRNSKSKELHLARKKKETKRAVVVVKQIENKKIGTEQIGSFELFVQIGETKQEKPTKIFEA